MPIDETGPDSEVMTPTFTCAWAAAAASMAMTATAAGFQWRICVSSCDRATLHSIGAAAPVPAGSRQMSITLVDVGVPAEPGAGEALRVARASGLPGLGRGGVGRFGAVGERLGEHPAVHAAAVEAEQRQRRRGN